MIKKIIIVLIVIVILSYGAYAYFTRPVDLSVLPSLEEVSKGLDVTEEDGELYRFSKEDSKIRFEIYELLRNEPFVVVGETNQLTGEFFVAIDKDNDILRIVSSAININANSFITDDERRDNAIRRFILKSEDPINGFIEFKPEILEFSLSDKVDNLDFEGEISGELKISGITKMLVFPVKATILGENKIIFIGEMLIKRSDFDLNIPNLPFVADVPDDFLVKFEILAKSVDN